MSSFLIRHGLSKDGIKLCLSNEYGYASNADSVKWTILDSCGEIISGKSIPAINSSVGEYYAPFFTDTKNGNYSVYWEIQETNTSEPRVVIEPIFIIDPSSYSQLYGKMKRSATPKRGGFTYPNGVKLGPYDLPLYLRNENGDLTDAFSVFWTIFDSCDKAISSRQSARSCDIGTYYAPWHVNAKSGSYYVLWEFMEECDYPLKSIKEPFDVVDGSTPIQTNSLYLDSSSKGNSCKMPYSMSPPTCIPYPHPPLHGSGQGNGCQGRCVGVCQGHIEVPRTVHLPLGMLPASSGFTNQQAYPIPNGVINISFYVSYQWGAPGGCASFVVMWGDGTSEYQEAIIENNIPGPQIMAFQNILGPVPPDGSMVGYVLYVSNPGGAKTVRLLANEAGNPGTPGIIGITLTASE